MCHDNGYRPAGQAVAILRAPHLSTGRRNPHMSCTLTFNNDSAQSTKKTSTWCRTSDLDNLTGPDNQDEQPCELLIHALGDLSKTQAANSVLYRSKITSNAYGALDIALPWRLNLGVGDDGIIGRAITMNRGSEAIGEGVIGWGVE